MKPAKRQLAWTASWIAACAALSAGRAAPARVALFLAGVALAAALRAALKNRSSYLALALGVALTGLTASTVAHLTAGTARVSPVTPALGATTCVFLIATMADGLARRRGLVYRMILAAALAVPVAWALVTLVAYVGYATARIELVVVKLAVSDPLRRALDASRVVFQMKVALALACGAIAALRSDR